MQKIVALIFFVFSLYSYSDCKQKNLILSERVWLEVKDPMKEYTKPLFKYVSQEILSLDAEGLKAINKDKKIVLAQQLSIDLDGDGDLDSLYTKWSPKWLSNGKPARVMDWYTINDNGKHYGWMHVSQYYDGREVIEASSKESFKLNIAKQGKIKTIQYPLKSGDSVYALLHNVQTTRGFMGVETVFFSESDKEGYEHQSQILAEVEVSSTLYQPEGINYYDGSQQTLESAEHLVFAGEFNVSSKGFKKFYQQYIKQYILKPKFENGYEITDSVNITQTFLNPEELKKQVAEANSQSESQNAQVKGYFKKLVQQSMLAKALNKTSLSDKPSVKERTQTQTNQWLYWLLGIGSLLSLFFLMNYFFRK